MSARTPLPHGEHSELKAAETGTVEMKSRSSVSSAGAEEDEGRTSNIGQDGGICRGRNNFLGNLLNS